MSVNVRIENVADLFSASPIKVKFDQSKLRLNDIVAGDLFSRDNVRVTSQQDIRNDTGEATLTVARFPGMPGISGSGTIVTLNFVALSKGATTVTITDPGLKNSKGQAITLPAREIPVTVQ